MKKRKWLNWLKPVLVLVLGFIGGLLASILILGYSGFNKDSDFNPLTKSNVQYDNSSDITKAIDKTKNAVVTVANYQKAPDKETEDAAREAGLEVDENGLVPLSHGSGVVYKKDGDNAYVITNAHVVADAEKLSIMLGTEKDTTKSIKAELVGSDTYSDLAVLKVKSSDVTEVAEFADSSKIKIGETVIAIGSPLDATFANTVTTGVISGIDRAVPSQADDGTTIQNKYLQTDAAINPGNSGGALINIEGQVIGINSSKIVLEGFEGLGFAIPSNDVVTTINQIEKDGKVVRPALGITMADYGGASDSVKSKTDVPDDITTGVVVGSVQEDMPSDGKLEEYDVITKIDDTEVKTVAELQEQLYNHKIGDTVTLTFYRDGEKKTVDIKLTKTSNDLENDDE